MSESQAPRANQELRARMDHGLTQLLAFLDDMSEQQMLQSTDAAGWNIRDHIVHLAVWADGIAALLRREDRWAAMGLRMGNPEDDELDYDALNAQIAAQHRHMAPAEAREWLAAAHRRAVAAVAALSVAELSAAYDRFVTPFTGDGGHAIAEYIAGNTYDHYVEHLPWMAAIAHAYSAPE